jgi:hypothetical protein
VNFLTEFIEILLDPAHLAAEAVFTVAVDTLGYGVLKRIVRRLVRREHAVIDPAPTVQFTFAPDRDHSLTEAELRELLDQGGWTEIAVSLQGGVVR